jgi:hypothetical protein
VCGGDIVETSVALQGHRLALIIIEDRDYEDVLEQLRVNAGFYEERSSDREVSEIDEFELLDSDDVVIEEEEEEEEIEPLIGRMAPTVWGSDGVSVYMK